MKSVSNFLQENIGLDPEIQKKILYSLIIIIVLAVIRYIILKVVWRVTEDPKNRYTWKRAVSFSIGFLSVLLVLSVWLKALGQLGAFLGLLTAGIAIAMKDPLTNIAGWMFILLRKPFGLGDRVS